MRYFLLCLIKCLFFNGICGHDFIHCSTNNLLDITNINLNPDPPIINSNLTILVNGKSNKEINSMNGEIIIKVLGIPLLEENIDLCTYVNCPITENEVVYFNITQTIPSLIPSGTTLDVKLDVKTEDKIEVSCLELTFKAEKKIIISKYLK